MRSIILSFVVGLLVGCAGTRQPAENLTWPFAEGYGKPLYVKEFTITPNEMYLTRFVLEGGSIEEWTEALESINTWRKNYPPTVEGAYQKLTQSRTEKCPGAAFNIIKQDSTSILYETSTADCPPYPDEYSLTRILYGNSDVFVLIYTNKVKELPKDKRDEWIRVLSAAKIYTE